MFKTIKEIYDYYVAECEAYKVYQENWKWLWPQHYRWSDVQRNKEEWRTRLHAMEGALGLTAKEKIEFF